jgi:hypothetical protein
MVMVQKIMIMLSRKQEPALLDQISHILLLLSDQIIKWIDNWKQSFCICKSLYSSWL